MASAFPLEALQSAVVTHDYAATAALLAQVKADAATSPDASILPRLRLQVAEAAHALADGEFLHVLSMPPAAEMCAPVDADERESTDPANFRDLVALFRWRAVKYIVQGAETEEAEEAALRAASAVFIAAAALGLYMQTNWTGPELDADALAHVNPLPYMRELLDLGDVPVAARAGWHAASHAETTVRVLSTGDSLSAPAAGGGGGGGASGGEEEDMDDKDIEAMMHKPRPKLQVMSLSALSTCGADVYEHVEVPHLLVTARALLTALLPAPSAIGTGSGASFKSSSEVLDALQGRVRAGDILTDDVAVLDPRFKRLYAAVARVSSADVWAARAACVHQRSLVERTANAALWAAALTHFRRAAHLYCPAHARAFIADDLFQRALVEADLQQATATDAGQRVADILAAETAADVGARDAAAAAAADDVLGDAAEDVVPPVMTGTAPAAAPAAGAAASMTASPGQVEAASVAGAAVGAHPESRAFVARFLLEWGHAQYFFGKDAAAKTSFFLAKRETALATQLTGALGRRTKYQKFDLAQLVLRARSTGAQADAALVDAKRAESLGAASGRFSAAALREAGVLTDGGSAAGGGSAADANVALGGVRTIKLDEVDASNILMEEIAFRDPALAGVTTAEDAEYEKLVYGKGWGASIAAASTLASLTAERGVGSDAAAASAEDGASAAAAADAVAADAAAAADAPAPRRVVMGGGGDVARAPEVEDGPLSALDQCIVLALCLDIKNHNPADGLTQAEMRPYVTRALDTPLNWMVYSTGLLIKSWLEFENHRTVERAVLQMQALVDQHTHRLTPLQFSRAVVDASAPARDRLAYVYALAFPSRWDLKRQCADRYRTLGVLRSALSLYEQLEMWDDIIQCHIALDKPKRATRLLRARLQAHPSPRLLCTLGEVTDDDAPILEAWNSSGRTYGRAQLLLGRRAFRRREYEAAVAAFRAGLALVPTSNRDWFLLGVLSMQLGQHEVALEAFSRVVQLEPQSADAWANIGSLYLRTKQWQRGYAALSQTLRMDSRDWRVWSNYLIACMHVRAYGRAIRTMHKLVDLRGRGAREEEDNSGVDVPCLGLLVQNVLASLEEEAAVAAARGDDAGDAPPPARKYVDMVGRPAALLLEDVAKLCGHIVSAVTKEAKVWQLYAKVQAARGRRADATDCRLRMCRALQSGGWEKEADRVALFADASKELIADLLATPTPRNLYQARMHVANAVDKVRAAEDAATCPGALQLAELLASVEEAERRSAAS